jgi:DNA-binding GntR family transcriptional regulator
MRAIEDRDGAAAARLMHLHFAAGLQAAA